MVVVETFYAAQKGMERSFLSVAIAGPIVSKFSVTNSFQAKYAR